MCVLFVKIPGYVLYFPFRIYLMLNIYCIIFCMYYTSVIFFKLRTQSKAWNVSPPHAGLCPLHTTPSSVRRALGSSKGGRESPTEKRARALVLLVG